MFFGQFSKLNKKDAMRQYFPILCAPRAPAHGGVFGKALFRIFVFYARSFRPSAFGLLFYSGNLNDVGKCNAGVSGVLAAERLFFAPNFVALRRSFRHSLIMKLFNVFLGLAAALAVGGCCGTGGVNSASVLKYDSFNPGQVWLDDNGRHINAHGAGAIFDNGRYYIFGEHKLGGTLGNKSVVGVHCYSSDDLYNWKDEGIALEMSGDPNSEIVRGTILERPKVIYNPRTKKYVMWMHLEFRKGPTAKSADLKDIYAEKPDYSTARAGVAVADKIAGPYKYVGSFRPNAGKYPINGADGLRAYRAELEKDPNWKSKKFKGEERKKALARGFAFLRDFDGGQMSRDMTLFADDDGRAYLGCASEDNSTFHIHELNSEYTGFTGRFARVFPGGYHEAPAFFKRGGKYYMFSSHCTGWAPNPGRVSVSDEMLGEWRELGNPCRGDGQKKSKTVPVEAKADTTFRSQSSAVIPVRGKKDAFIYFGDRWIPEDAIDGRYIVLPVEWEGSGEGATPVIRWRDKWKIEDVFKD